jgi:hypothetical protein
MTDLLPCPFCGSSNVELIWAWEEASVVCHECHSGTGHTPSGDRAIEIWNRRAAPVQPAGLTPKYPVELRCAELEELLRELGKALKALPATDGRVIGLIPFIDRIDAALTPPAREEAVKRWICKGCGKKIPGGEARVSGDDRWHWKEELARWHWKDARTGDINLNMFGSVACGPVVEEPRRST